MLKSVIGRVTVPVRWATKPRWIPVAKTKMFRVPVRKRLPKEESDLVLPQFNIYRTQMRALKRIFLQKIERSMTGEDVLSESARQEHEAHLRALALNDKWNAEVAVERERILTERRLAEQEKILQAVEEAKQAAEVARAQAEARVRLEKERSKSYITRENVDEAIERALSERVDIEFAVDLDCNVYNGRRAKPKSRLSPETPLAQGETLSRQEGAAH